MRKAWAAVALLAAGCGGGVGTVDGRLVYPDGSPVTEVEHSMVTFESAALKVSGRGEVRKDGTFAVGPDLSDGGLPPGEYQVFISEHRENADAGGSRLKPTALDEKYANPGTSGLTATLKSGKNDVTLKVEKAKKK